MRTPFVAGSPKHSSRRLPAIGLTLAAVLAASAVPAAVPAANAAAAPLTAGPLTAGPLAAGPLAVSAAPAVIRADADTYVVRERPDRAHGDADKLVASGRSSWHSQVLLRFTVPAARAGRPARAVLTLTPRGSAGRADALSLRRVSGSWSERTTYADRPSLGGTAGRLVGGSGSAVSFDVTDAVTGPGTYAFALTSRAGSVVFHSVEAGDDGPRLSLDYGETAGGGTGGGAQNPGRGGTLCAASFATESKGETMRQALARVDGYYGTLELIRIFNSGLPKPWDRMLDVNGRPVNVSFKADPDQVVAGRFDAELREWFADAPRDRDTYWTYFHEPEDDIERGRFTADRFKAAFEHLSKLADEAKNPRLKATLILMGWSFDSRSRRVWTKYLPDTRYVDVVAVDWYNQGRKADKPKYNAPADMFDKIIAEITGRGLPFAVAETGSTIVKGDDGSGRAKWLRDLTRYLTEKGALYVAYFDHDWKESGDDFRLRDAAGKAAWRDFCDS